MMVTRQSDKETAACRPAWKQGLVSLGFWGLPFVSRSEYDAMKQGLENTVDMTVVVAIILCILVGVVALLIGNIMGSKTLEDSRKNQLPAAGEEE